MTLSVVIITHNEEKNLARTLVSVAPLVREGAGEIIVLDCGSTDRTREIAQMHGAKVFVEPWKGYAAQKNSAIEKASGDWVLSLDADEALEPGLVREIQQHTSPSQKAPRTKPEEWCLTMPPGHKDAAERLRSLNARPVGFWIPRQNFFLGRWMRHGSFWPDRKLRLFRRGAGRFEQRAVHETVRVSGPTDRLSHCILHNAYPGLAGYLGHMNRYSSLGAEMAGPRGFSLVNIVLRPLATFIYNYFLRLGFLDGREGLLLHLYHAVYVSWKYAKAWELGRKQPHSAPNP